MAGRNKRAADMTNPAAMNEMEDACGPTYEGQRIAEAVSRTAATMMARMAGIDRMASKIYAWTMIGGKKGVP
jgi:hypothetical protein